MAQVINGGDLMLFIDGESVAFATSHKLSINVETVETTCLTSWQPELKQMQCSV